MLHKEKEFAWTQQQEHAFERLKQAMTTAPLLVLPDPKLPYVVMTDASSIAIGASLNQDQGKGLQPIAFLSKKLLPAETRYPTHEQEELAIIIALKKWRHYLHGTKVKVLTDHKSLQYLYTQPHLSLRQQRWSEFLSEFDLEIEYKKGKDNVVADALSRRIDHDERNQLQEESGELETNADVINAVSYLQVNPLNKEIKLAYGSDPKCKEILNGPVPAEFTVTNGMIYKDKRLYIPNDTVIKAKIMNEFHDSPVSGHVGVTKTIELVS